VNAAALLCASPALVFDLDGTLVDTLPDLTDALNQALREHGRAPVSSELVRGSLHGGIETSVEAALGRPGEADPALAGAVLARYQWLLDDQPVRLSRPYPGVAALLQHCRARGQRLAVCTNKREAQARRVLNELDLADFFSVVVGADTCSRRKPHAEPLLHAIAGLDCLPAQAVLVGDSPVDQACAAAARIGFLFFTGGYGGSPAGFAGGSGPMPAFGSYPMLLASLDG
jgi:phosphoglycolate phosphatase